MSIADIPIPYTKMNAYVENLFAPVCPRLRINVLDGFSHLDNPTTKTGNQIGIY